MNNFYCLDLGMHIGEDSEFYLKLGHDVVAVEANKNLCDSVNEKLRSYVQENKFKILNKAISDKSGNKIDFYIHKEKSDWSSCSFSMLEKEQKFLEKVSVDTINLDDLFQQNGIPYYLKCDVEGFDVDVANQLLKNGSRPQFVSFEISKNNYADIFIPLKLAGYKKFQLVNQMINQNRLVELKTKDGKEIKHHFGNFSSGLFGSYLREDQWLTFDEALSRYMKYRELKFIDNINLALGWIDLHASF